LGIKSLLSVGCKTIANMCRGKSSAEYREMFNISMDPPASELTMNDDTNRMTDMTVSKDIVGTFKANATSN
jgi:hypothetical protein